MLQKLNRLWIILVIVTMATGWLVISCEEEDTLIELYSFGPSPALRGGELMFIGNNLDKVTAAILPENIEVTSFTQQESGLITLVVPEATVDGKVVLKTPQGDIETKTVLKISETIMIDTIAPLSVRPGEVLTINGDYLNLVKAVIFTKDVMDTVFQSQSKTSIEIVVPEEARTGIITLSNREEPPILVPSDYDIEIILPAITGLTPNPVKAGSVLTITGSNLTLTSSVVFGGGRLVTGFESVSDNSLAVTVPGNAEDGKIKLGTASGVEVESEEELLMLLPAISSINPNPARNGDDITISGSNLDLVTSVGFGGETTGVIQDGGSVSEIVVTVPLEATEDVITLYTDAGKTVESSQVLTLLLPTITSFSPTTVQTVDKPSITISGTNLDLVSEVVFEGDWTAKVSSLLENELTVDVVPGSITGPFTLISTNGSETVSDDPLTIVPYVPDITDIPVVATIDSLITLYGTNMDIAADIYFPGDIVATRFGAKTSTMIEVFVPKGVPIGEGKIKLITYNNEIVETDIIKFTKAGLDPVIDWSLVYYDFDGKNEGWSDAGKRENLSSLSLTGSYWRVNESCENWTTLFLSNNSTRPFPGAAIGTDIDNYVVKFDINILAPITAGQIRLRFNEGGGTDYDFWYLWAPWESGGDNMTDGWITVTVPLSEFRSNYGAGDNVLTDMSLIDEDYGIAYDGGSSLLNICIDNVRFEYTGVK